MKINYLTARILFLLVLFLYQLLGAQTKTRIEGIVTDSKSNPLPYVNVFLLNTTDGAMSDDEGNFSFVSLEKGKDLEGSPTWTSFMARSRSGTHFSSLFSVFQ